MLTCEADVSAGENWPTQKDRALREGSTRHVVLAWAPGSGATRDHAMCSGGMSLTFAPARTADQSTRTTESEVALVVFTRSSRGTLAAWPAGLCHVDAIVGAHSILSRRR